jgi:hypothetical protein
MIPLGVFMASRIFLIFNISLLMTQRYGDNGPVSKHLRLNKVNLLHFLCFTA